MSSLFDLNEAMKSAPDFEIEVLAGAELDFVAGGPFSGNSPDSNTISQCATDGNDEPGTS